MPNGYDMADAKTLSEYIIHHTPEISVFIKENNEEWEKECKDFASTILEKKSEKSLEEYLSRIRKKIIDRESFTKDFNGEIVRIFPPKTKNILLDKYDIFGRGIDTARAVLEIINCAETKNEKVPLRLRRLLREALKKLHSDIQKFDDTYEGLQQAEQELKKFNTALCSLLHISRICPSISAAEKSINFVRDFLWKKTWQDESFCTIMPNHVKNPENKGMLLRLAKPMIVENDIRESIWETSISRKWYWYEKLAFAYGTWFNTFFKNHKEDLSRIATTPMSRITPGLANAYDSVIISVNNQGQVAQTLQGTQLAITEPPEVERDYERSQITRDSHVSIVFGKQNHRLLGLIKKQCNRWGFLLSKEKKEMDIPILHQTLIGDQIFPLLFFLIPDTKKSQTALDNRENANAYLRKILDPSNIYYNPTGGDFIIHKRDEKKVQPEGYYKINIKILETNNCINNHFRYTRVRNNDLNHSRELIKMAVSRLVEFQRYLESKQSQSLSNNLHTIIRFLESSNYSWVNPYKSYDENIDKAIKEFTRELRQQDYSYPLSAGTDLDIPLTLRNDLALLAQAAAELKCTVHESIGGWARRWFNNTFGQIPLVGWFLRFSGWVISLPFRLLQVPWTIPMYLKHNSTRRKTAHKAVNEQMVAELLGEKFGGCMSSEDRGEEIEQFKEANMRAFHDRGRILGFNEEPIKKKEFMRYYGNTTQEKHNFNKMSTGSPTSSDTETRPWFGSAFGGAGIFSAEEKPAEQRLSKEMEHLRKGAYDKSKISIEAYLKNAEKKPAKKEEKTEELKDEKPFKKVDFLDSKVSFFVKYSEPTLSDDERKQDYKLG